MALFALPPHPCPGLFPYPLRKIQFDFPFDFGLTLGLDVARVSVGPLAQLGRIPWALCAPNVTALFADSGCGRNEKSIASVAGAPDPLLDRMVDSLFASFGGNRQELLLLRLVGPFRLFALLDGRLLLGIAGALLAALVLTLGADFVGAISRVAVVAGAMHTHADGLLNSLDTDGLGRGGDPLVGLEREAIFGE